MFPLHLDQRESSSQLLLAKIHFSKTQDIYFKTYGYDNSYLQKLDKLLPKVHQKKLQIIIDEVASSNHGFKKYLQKQKISKISIEDVMRFQASLKKSKDHFEAQRNLSFESSKTENSSKQLSNDIIKIGFMMILQKLEKEKANSFICEVKYLKETIERYVLIVCRQHSTLKSYGYEYEGVKNQKRSDNFKEEIQYEEKENGQFTLVSEKNRKEVTALRQCQSFLQSIMSETS